MWNDENTNKQKHLDQREKLEIEKLKLEVLAQRRDYIPKIVIPLLSVIIGCLTLWVLQDDLNSQSNERFKKLNENEENLRHKELKILIQDSTFIINKLKFERETKENEAKLHEQIANRLAAEKTAQAMEAKIESARSILNTLENELFIAYEYIDNQRTYDNLNLFCETPSIHEHYSTYLGNQIIKNDSTSLVIANLLENYLLNDTIDEEGKIATYYLLDLYYHDSQSADSIAETFFRLLRINIDNCNDYSETIKNLTIEPSWREEVKLKILDKLFKLIELKNISPFKLGRILNLASIFYYNNNQFFDSKPNYLIKIIEISDSLKFRVDNCQYKHHFYNIAMLFPQYYYAHLLNANLTEFNLAWKDTKIRKVVWDNLNATKHYLSTIGRRSYQQTIELMTHFPNENNSTSEVISYYNNYKTQINHWLEINYFKNHQEDLMKAFKSKTW